VTYLVAAEYLGVAEWLWPRPSGLESRRSVELAEPKQVAGTIAQQADQPPQRR
jgi:hypothetical protein